MTNLYSEKVTIFNDIPKGAVEDRHFDRFVIEKCLVHGGVTHTVNGTIVNIANSQTVITKDKRYKSPAEYDKLPIDEREKWFTIRINDFVVFGEVNDIVTDAIEFRDLQKKYKDMGMVVTAVNVNHFGLDVDNIKMTNM